MRRALWIVIACLCVCSLACGKKQVDSGAPSSEGNPRGNAGASAGKAGELILGPWELVKGSETGIAWETLYFALDSDKGFAFDFRKDDSVSLHEGSGRLGVGAAYSLGEDGSLEVSVKSFRMGPEGEIAQVAKLKLKAQVTKDELVMKDNKGKIARFQRRGPIEEPPAPPAKAEPTAEMKKAAESIQKAGGSVEFRSSSPGSFVTFDAPRRIPLFVDVYLTKAMPLNPTLTELRPQLAQLPVLQLRLKGVDDATLAILKDLPNLDLLDLGEASVTDDGMAQLTKLSNLRLLKVKSDKLTEGVFVHIGALTNLQAFSVREDYSGHRLTDVSLNALKKLTRLEQLRIDGDKEKLTDAGFATLRGMKELSFLHMHGLDISDAALQSLAELTKLRDLTFDYCSQINGSGFVHLKGLKDLENLELRHCGKLIPEGTDHLAALSGLKQFYVQRSFSTADHYRCLKGMTNLEEFGFDEDGFDDACMPHLAGLTRVRKLSYLAEKNISDASLKWLGGLSSLEYLSLQKTKVKGAGLTHLKSCVKLQSLSLAETGIDDQSLVVLAELKQLRQISLPKTKVSDAGLVHLQGFDRLTHLDLSDTAVSDKSLDLLKGFSQLSGLYLRGTKVTPEGITDLKKALPKANIQGP